VRFTAAINADDFDRGIGDGAAGFGGMVPDCMRETDSAPTFWAGLLIAGATKFS